MIYVSHAAVTMLALFAGLCSKGRAWLQRLRQPVDIESTVVSYWPTSLCFVDPLLESAFIANRTAKVKSSLALCFSVASIYLVYWISWRKKRYLR